MKKTIFIAMMLIGMMGSAQTIDNPIVVNEDSSLYDVWISYDYDTTTKYFMTKNRNESLNVALGIMYNAYGRTKWPKIKDSYEDGVSHTEWILPENHLLEFIKNENDKFYIIVVFDYNEN